MPRVIKNEELRMKNEEMGGSGGEEIQNSEFRDVGGKDSSKV